MFKFGDKVEIIRKRAHPATGAASGWDEGEDAFKGRIGYVANSLDAGCYTVFSTPSYSGHYYGIFEADELKPVKEAHMYEEGQILVREAYGSTFEAKVLGATGHAVLLSNDNDFDYADTWYAPRELDDRGYKLKQEVEEPEAVELTIEEIADKFFIDPAQVRIKKEA